ncbi:hypothetical protein [Actinomadura napierensis]|uniref:Uncharacterized protein n=1 Tax=Actinomadura napierensis TaxID=267854 RepID=A0ABP5K6Q3_9ACTN
MRFGRGRSAGRERPADSDGGPLSLKLEELRKKHEELLAELAEAQRMVAAAGSTRRQLEEQLKAVEGRPEAEDIADRYDEATVSEKNLIDYEREVRTTLDVFVVQKTTIEEHLGQLRSLTEAD